MILLGTLVVISLILAWVTLSKTRRFYSAAIIYAFTFLTPVVIVWRHCQVTSVSEACVWGKSLMPLYWSASLVAGTGLLLVWALVLWGIAKARE